MTIDRINTLILELENKLLYTQGTINRYLIVQEIKSLNNELEAQTEYYYL
jgi:hypothetical protein